MMAGVAWIGAAERGASAHGPWPARLDLAVRAEG
jgi:hypothetical protein